MSMYIPPGKAVAHVAKKVGYDAVIYVPKCMAKSRREAIEKEGAKVIVVRRRENVGGRHTC